MLCTNKLGKTPFKLQNTRPHPTLIGQDSATKNFDGCIDLLLSKKRLIDPDQFSQIFCLSRFSAIFALVPKRVGPKQISEQFLSSSSCKSEKQSHLNRRDRERTTV